MQSMPLPEKPKLQLHEKVEEPMRVQLAFGLHGLGLQGLKSKYRRVYERR